MYRAAAVSSFVIVSVAAAPTVFADTGGVLLVDFDVVPAALGIGDEYGTAVAIDGDRLAVGSTEKTTPAGTGRVHVFERQNGSWSEVATLVAAELPPDNRFGTRVALEGDTLMATAVLGVTAVYVFEFDGAAWNEGPTIVAAPPNAVAGGPIDLCGDTLVAGTGNSAPRVHVFERTGSNWSATQETVLVASDGENIGSAVAIDGDVIVAGAPSYKVGGAFNAGRAYVFERVAGTWSETAVLDTINPVTLGFYGVTVAVAGDRIAVGSPFSAPPGQLSGTGLVELFARQRGAWVRTQLIANPTLLTNDFFGHRLALSGGRLLVAAPGALDNVGRAWLYALEDDTWSLQLGLDAPPNLVDSYVGDSVAIDGDRCVLGAPEQDLQGNKSGSVHVYERVTSTPLAYCTAKTSADGCVPAVGWSGSASLTGADDFVVLAGDAPPGKNGLFFWGTSGSVAVPFLGGTLCVAPALTRGPVSVSTGNAPCDAGFVLPFPQALMQQEGLALCQTVHGQWWIRDPQNPDGTGAALSDGIEFTVDF